MRRRVDVFFVLTLFALLALFVRAHTWLGPATAESVARSVKHGPPSATLNGPTTKFDLLFGKPELALP